MLYCELSLLMCKKKLWRAEGQDASDEPGCPKLMANTLSLCCYLATPAGIYLLGIWLAAVERCLEVKVV